MGPADGKCSMGVGLRPRKGHPWSLYARRDATTKRTMPQHPQHRILVTAGPTFEALDCVRSISNHSSGRLGGSIALAAAIAGHETTLLLGPGSAATACHPRLSIQRFTSARELGALIGEHWPSHDLLIMAAAVADYTPKGGQRQGKHDRNGSMGLELVATADLVAAAAADARDDQRVIAFALEDPADLDTRARAKLKAKGVDAIVANPLATMEHPRISACVIRRDGDTLEAPSDLPKPAFAAWLVAHLDEIVT